MLKNEFNGLMSFSKIHIGKKEVLEMELNFKNCFKYYDDELLKCLNFEVRLKNYKIAEFNNIDCFLEYILMLNTKNKKYRWFFYDSKTVVFDFL